MLCCTVDINCVTRSGRALAEPQLVEARAYVVTHTLPQLLSDVLRKDMDQSLSDKYNLHTYIRR